MSNRAWMPLHIDDYLADTGHLTGAEHGAYLLMIMHYWQNGKMPENERLIARLARMDSAQWEESREVLAMLFGPNWTHKRIDAELTKADDIIEKRRAAANGRHQKGKGDASAVHVHSTSTDTGALPRTLDQGLEKQEPSGSSKKRGTRLPDDFSPDMAAAVEAGLSQAEAQREALKFRDYWISQPGQKGVKLDWPATWRNWCRHAVERRPQQRGGSPPAETVGSFSRKQLFEQRQNDATDNSSGRVVQIDARRLENSPSGTRTFAVSGNLLGRI
ncbi:YdaU family protein [Mesorhizobium sp. A556]